jgi:hypothetical protein
VLTGAVRRSGRRSLNDRCAVSGQAPGSGAERRDQVLDEVSTAILGGDAAENAALCGKFEAQRKICPTAAFRYAISASFTSVGSSSDLIILGPNRVNFLDSRLFQW